MVPGSRPDDVDREEVVVDDEQPRGREVVARRPAPARARATRPRRPRDRTVGEDDDRDRRDARLARSSRMIARLPPQRGDRGRSRGRPAVGAAGAGRARTPSRTTQIRTSMSRARTTPRDRLTARGSAVDDPVGRAAVEVSEVGGPRTRRPSRARSRRAGWRRASRRTSGRCGPARTTERHVEVAARDVLVEVVGEEQHRPAQGRVLEHDRRVVGDEQVDREQQVVDVDRRATTRR